MYLSQRDRTFQLFKIPLLIEKFNRSEIDKFKQKTVNKKPNDFFPISRELRHNYMRQNTAQIE